MNFGMMKWIGRKQFALDLYDEINEDGVSNGAAALAYYLFLAIFPAMIFLLSLIPYLPIQNLHQAVMDFIREALPGTAYKAFEGIVAEVTLKERAGLLSFGALATLWAASSGTYAVMQQLNVTYDVRESRPFWKARLVAIGLTALFGILILASFALIVLGGVGQDWIVAHFALGPVVTVFFWLFRWVVIAALLLAGFSLMYFIGPDVEQKFKFITPGSLIGVVVLALASVGFRVYVESFSDYAATYGSIGAVIVLMLFLYIAGLVILVGSEINALFEHYSPDGKNKGERTEPKNSRGYKLARWHSRNPGESAPDKAERPPLPETKPRKQAAPSGQPLTTS